MLSATPGGATAGAPPFPRCAAATTVRSACAGVVDDLHDRWDLPSASLLIDGRLRCQASHGYFQPSARAAVEPSVWEPRLQRQGLERCEPADDPPCDRKPADDLPHD